MVEKWFHQASVKGEWSPNAIATTRSWLGKDGNGLQPRFCFSLGLYIFFFQGSWCIWLLLLPHTNTKRDEHQIHTGASHVTSSGVPRCPRRDLRTSVFMSGSMLLSATSPSPQITCVVSRVPRLSRTQSLTSPKAKRGAAGGTTQNKSNCGSLWARITFPFTVLSFRAHLLEPIKITLCYTTSPLPSTCNTRAGELLS